MYQCKFTQTMYIKMLLLKNISLMSCC